MVTTISGFPFKRQPINNVTPFTYRDGTTYLEILEGMRNHFNQVIVEEFNGVISDAIDTLINGLADAKDTYNTGMSDATKTYLEGLSQLSDKVIATEAAHAKLISDVKEYVYNIIQSVNNKTGPLDTQTVTLTENRTVVVDPIWPTNLPLNFSVLQDGTGGHNLTFGGGITSPGFDLNKLPNGVTRFTLYPLPNGGWEAIQLDSRATLTKILARGYSVKDPRFAGGAIGNGRDDDTASVLAAVAESFATKQPLFWPNGSYKVTANIPNLHKITHTGPGWISRDGATFFPSPTSNRANTIHVAPPSVASDDNDGLTPDLPTNVQTALNYLMNYGPVLGGTWTIQHAEGVYPGGYAVPRVQMERKLKYQGVPMNAMRATPKTVYTAPSASPAAWGVYTSERQQITFTDIKFVDFNRTTVNSGGIRVGEYNSVDLVNIHTDNCEIGFFALDHVVYNYKGCLFDNSKYAAIHELYMTLRNSTALNMDERTVMSNGQFGIKSKELNTGHADRTEFINNVWAVHLSRSCTMNMSYSIFKRNRNCVTVAGSSAFVDLYCEYGTGVDANTVKYRYVEGASNVSRAETENALSSPYIGMTEKTAGYFSAAGKKHQGTTADTVIAPLTTFKAGELRGEGSYFTWEAYGSCHLTAECVLRLRINSGGAAVVTLPAGTYMFKFEGRCYTTKDGNFQRADSVLHRSNGNPIFGGGERTFDFTIDAVVGIYAQLSNTEDSILIDQAVIKTTDL